jgi:hypothetical protein
MFPLEIGSMEQYNLLYAVSFLQNPDDTDGFSLGSGTGKEKEKDGGRQELQRAVTINIVGKPAIRVVRTLGGGAGAGDSARAMEMEEEESRSYPTLSFTSRWNCILDLSPQPHRLPGPSASYDHEIKDALPEPASPFPMSQSQSQQYQQYQYQGQQSQQSPHTATTSNFAQAQAQVHDRQVAGSKQYTTGAAAKGVKGNLTRRVYQPREREASPKIAYTPPSIAVQSQQGGEYLSSPTTYGPPPSAGGGGGMPRSSFGYDSSDLAQYLSSGYHTPQTPAYPAYPSYSSMSPSPLSHVPISSLQSGSGGPSVEIRRQRGAGAGSAGASVGAGGVVQSPGPMVVGAERGMAMAAAMQNVVDEDEGEPIVVSVGLLPSSSNSKWGSGGGGTKIYPLDTFALDIFVFNQSTWTRRFEISSPDQRRRRKQDSAGAGAGAGAGIRYGGGGAGKDLLRGLGDRDKPGILPLENRIRIGSV